MGISYKTRRETRRNLGSSRISITDEVPHIQSLPEKIQVLQQAYKNRREDRLLGKLYARNGTVLEIIPNGGKLDEKVYYSILTKLKTETYRALYYHDSRLQKQKSV